MPGSHSLLLANFYGGYVDSSHFKASVVVNNAGIEQLASLGVDKLKELKGDSPARNEFYVLIMAGLTDVLIKSVEQNKNKLEITPNSTQLIETKMEWAHNMLSEEGAIVVWAIMPPISLKMYHQTEGWNVYKIPGMSPGLEREQSQLNQLMYNYRNLCTKLNGKEAKRVTPGPFFTDMVAELSSDRKSMTLNVSFFESDGITPTKNLTDDWNAQIKKMNMQIEKQNRRLSTYTPSRDDRKSKSNDPWSVPANHSADLAFGRSGKRPYVEQKRGLHDYRNSSNDPVSCISPERKRLRDRSPTSIPSLLDIKPSPSKTKGGNLERDNTNFEKPEQIATAMQLLAATMQLGGGTSHGGNNLHAVMSLLASQKKNDAEIQKRYEEERAAEYRRAEEERMYALQKQLDEERKREEIRKERQRQIDEERLREIQMAAQRAMERQQRDQQEKLEAMQRQLRQAQLAAEKQAQLELVAKKIQQQAQIRSKTHMPSLLDMSTRNSSSKPISKLDKINEKIEKQKRDFQANSKVANKETRPDPKVINNPAWKQPVVLFSFVNRNNQKKPLRGISGARIPPASKNAISNHRSRGEHVYRRVTGPTPSVNFLKLKMNRPGELSSFEDKVASFNNRLYDMMIEGEKLIDEGKSLGYQLKKEAETASSNDSQVIESTGNTKITTPVETSIRKEKVAKKEKTSKPTEIKEANINPVDNPSKLPLLHQSIKSEHQRKESSLPPAELAKPRWDKSDNESDEELIWEDAETAKTVEDDDMKSTASVKDDTLDDVVIGTEQSEKLAVVDDANGNQLVQASSIADELVKTSVVNAPEVNVKVNVDSAVEKDSTQKVILDRIHDDIEVNAEQVISDGDKVEPGAAEDEVDLAADGFLLLDETS